MHGVVPVMTWSLILLGTSVGLVALRESLDRAHVAMVLLLVVLGAGARGGRVLGVLIGLASQAYAASRLARSNVARLCAARRVPRSSIARRRSSVSSRAKGCRR